MFGLVWEQPAYGHFSLGNSLNTSNASVCPTSWPSQPTRDQSSSAGKYAGLRLALAYFRAGICPNSSFPRSPTYLNCRIFDQKATLFLTLNKNLMTFRFGLALTVLPELWTRRTSVSPRRRGGLQTKHPSSTDSKSTSRGLQRLERVYDFVGSLSSRLRGGAYACHSPNPPHRDVLNRNGIRNFRGTNTPA